MAEDEAQSISLRMAELRRDLSGDVHEVSRNARAMTDWTFYVRRFPLAMVGLAAVTGFLLVPKRKTVISPDQEALAEMVRKKQLRLDVDHKREKPSLLTTLLTLAASGAAKTAMRYVGEQLQTIAVQRPPQFSREEVSTASIH